MFCENCGTELNEGSVFCSNCGKKIGQQENTAIVERTSYAVEPVQQNANRIDKFKVKSNPVQYVPSNTVSPKSRLLAALLAFFLGGFGAHRFYAGRPFSAVIQLLTGFSFFAALICVVLEQLIAGAVCLVLGVLWGIWILVDFILILCGCFKDKNSLPIINWDF